MTHENLNPMKLNMPNIGSMTMNTMMLKKMVQGGNKAITYTLRSCIKVQVREVVGTKGKDEGKV